MTRVRCQTSQVIESAVPSMRWPSSSADSPSTTSCMTSLTRPKASTSTFDGRMVIDSTADWRPIGVDRDAG